MKILNSSVPVGVLLLSSKGSWWLPDSRGDKDKGLTPVSTLSSLSKKVRHLTRK